MSNINVNSSFLQEFGANAPFSPTHPVPVIRAFFDQPTNTISYLVADPVTRRAAVIDAVLDFDQRDGTVDIRSVEAILAAAKEAKLTIEWVLETHAHADPPIPFEIDKPPSPGQATHHSRTTRAAARSPFSFYAALCVLASMDANIVARSSSSARRRCVLTVLAGIPSRIDRSWRLRSLR